jgi:F0F1-type ATP synthase assembly protein I
MKVGAGVVGLLIALIGAVFAGQGLGYFPGSVMTNDIKWFWIGLVMVILGLAVAAWSFLSRRRSHT